jgi:hypothetical protein
MTANNPRYLSRCDDAGRFNSLAAGIAFADMPVARTLNPFTPVLRRGQVYLRPPMRIYTYSLNFNVVITNRIFNRSYKSVFK